MFVAPWIGAAEGDMMMPERGLRPGCALLLSCMLAMFGTPAGAQTQYEMNQRSAEEFGRADKALNVTYQRVLGAISPKGQAALRQAQRTWVKFRDENCRFETMGNEGGSVYPLIFNMCRTQMTEARTTELKAQLHCEEGVLNCGGQ